MLNELFSFTKTKSFDTSGFIVISLSILIIIHQIILFNRTKIQNKSKITIFAPQKT